MKKYLKLLVASLVLTAMVALPAVSQNLLSNVDTVKETKNSLFVIRKESLIYKLVENQPVALFKIQHKFRLYSLSVSPNERYFAFIDIKGGEYYTLDSQMSGKYDVLPEIYLRIVNQNGELIHSLKDAQRYVWSPDGNQIAYITFDLTYAEYQYHRPTGLYVFDIISGETRQINRNATELNWATHDNCLYFIDYSGGRINVRRWAPQTDKIERTDYKDIYFSPDGKYYLSLWKLEYKPIQLYQSASNQELFAIKAYIKDVPVKEKTELLPEDIGELWQSKLRFPLHGWIPGSAHLLLFIKADVENYIFDVEKREVVGQFSGKPTEWIGNGKIMVVKQDDNLVMKELTVED